MKKKLLFIAPDYYGFNEVVYNGLKKYSGYEVIHINSTGPYKYKNWAEKIYNFFLKIFLKKNIKDIKRGQHIQRIIAENKYDLLLINRPDVLSENDFNFAIKQSSFSIALFWDSIQKIPSQKKFIKLFNICYSFDSDDCYYYNLEYITNFYFVKENSFDIKYDVSYLATYDQRINESISLFNYFNQQGISAKGRIFKYKSIPLQEKLPQAMEVIYQIIPFAESYKYYLDSRIILDIAHPHQKGLSFRPFEAIGLQKKIITTNREIINYDFYNPNNILIIDDIQNINIPEAFLQSEFQPYTEEIKEKYYIKNWIKTILSYNEN
ncbi:lipopolysaccharide core biosynthesis protein rfaS [uncultured Chryseobacterium sp.]|uniref:lipopolysaccharide core biosynthesis protein rfaS n=1 Tax=uncultured Chryseobacterium sp. TaxID=259322 RepID=UPI0025FFA109|nr:lipopolysaccharide core biosynthesis protein rfaS [uncultured Chryseobacterium sp.]